MKFLIRIIIKSLVLLVMVNLFTFVMADQGINSAIDIINLSRIRDKMDDVAWFAKGFAGNVTTAFKDTKNEYKH